MVAILTDPSPGGPNPRDEREHGLVLQAAGVGPIAPLADPALEARLEAAWAAKTMPAGALGEVQVLGTRIARIAGAVAPSLQRCAMLVFAGDHGLAAEGVSAYPAEVTAQMVRNFGEGGAAVAVLCRTNDIALTIVDAGTLVPQAPDFAPSGARFIDARIAAGTTNALGGAAMTETQALRAIAAGATIARATDADAIALGEMGIGNSSAAAMLATHLPPAPLGDCVGRGTGIDDARFANKHDVLARCLAVQRALNTARCGRALSAGRPRRRPAGAHRPSAGRNRCRPRSSCSPRHEPARSTAGRSP
jgi:nicotinate-nucleotide--dimethylbenzimidazole phosphoribosyltransferase